MVSDEQIDKWLALMQKHMEAQFQDPVFRKHYADQLRNVRVGDTVRVTCPFRIVSTTAVMPMRMC